MNRNGRIMFWTMVAVGVAVNVLLGCGPIRKNCGAYRVRKDGATCRECVDQDGRFNECGMMATEQR